MNIKENISHLLKQIPDNVKLVAVSKTKSIEEILEATRLANEFLGKIKFKK